MMIDEFPQAIENIEQELNEREARQFLYANREFRLITTDKFKFLYTGSIGLFPLTEKLGASDAINDLNTVEIEALELDEAKQMVKNILQNVKVPFQEEAIHFLVEKVGWNIPFHLQLVIQELIDIYEDEEKELGITHIDKAMRELCGKKNDIYFEHYYKRLEEAFQGNEQDFVFSLLKTLALNEPLNKEAIQQLALEKGLERYRPILSSLEYDGYIFCSNVTDDPTYQFTSPIIKMWWKKTQC